MGEIHELFVLALSLVWFAGATPDHEMGHTPSTAGTFRKKFRKNSGKTPESLTLSESFLEFSSRVRLGSPKPYVSRHMRLPEHFQNSLPPSAAGDASFFRGGFGEGLSEPVMEFPAVLGGISDERLFFFSRKTLRFKRSRMAIWGHFLWRMRLMRDVKAGKLGSREERVTCPEDAVSTKTKLRKLAFSSIVREGFPFS